jgi:diguanylate cyclase
MNVSTSSLRLQRDSNTQAPKVIKPVKSLTKVLGESEHARGLVEECAEGLSSVKEALKQELADGDSLPGVEDALEKSEAAESKAQQASEKLSSVNRALEAEVKERHVLEKRLAQVTEQGEAARHDALHDPLTGLANRALFNDRLVHGLVQAQRHGWGLAVLFIDLDNFKSVNDSFGHSAGDDVLRTIGARLKENARGGDTVSRYGGDEFLCLLLDVEDEHDISVIAEKIITSIRTPVQFNAQAALNSVVTASVGVSIFPRDGATASDLINSADHAMYLAKRNGTGWAFAE